MKNRLAIALVIQLVAVLFSFNGWVDAWFGGAAIVMVALLTIVAWLIGRVPIPPLTWISLLAAIVLSAVTVGLLVVSYDPMGSDAQFADNSLSSTISALNIVFRVAAVAVIAGTVFYAMRIWDTRRQLN